MDVRTGSRTAVLVCQGRAVADGRLAVGRFSDPIAATLLRDDELTPVSQARSGNAPRDARARMAMEAVRACAEVVVPRTVAIDDAIFDAGCEQVAVVGAGLDARPWRMHALRNAIVFSVDHPLSQADLRERVDGVPVVAGRLEFVPVDLTRTRLDDALAGTDHDVAKPTTWVWEGVVPYLTAADVETTVEAIAERSARGSVLVVNYQSPSWVASFGRHLAGVIARMTGGENVLAAEPWRSAWTADTMSRLLARHGFEVKSDESLLTVAGRLGSPTTNSRSVGTGRVAVAVRS